MHGAKGRERATTKTTTTITSKSPFIWRLTFGVACAYDLAMLHIFMCQSSISRTSFIYSKKRNDENSKSNFGRKQRNKKKKRIHTLRHTWYVPKMNLFGPKFYGLRLVEFYTFLIKNHWLFYTSEKLIFNSILSLLLHIYIFIFIWVFVSYQHVSLLHFFSSLY